MLSVSAVSSVLPFEIATGASPCGGAWVAQPTWAPPEMKATSMLLTVMSPRTPACGAKACRTRTVVRMWTSAATDPGAVIHVEQPDAATDGAAGAPGAAGRLAAAPAAPVAHPVRPAAAVAAVMPASRLIRFNLRAPDRARLALAHLACLPASPPVGAVGNARPTGQPAGRRPGAR